MSGTIEYPRIPPVDGQSHRPKVSVVTACFNACEALKTTVASVASQTYGDVEHVVVDGGSSDGTPTYLESQDSHLVWVSEPDEGIADAMNKGIRLARGEWIIVLQAGDRFATEDALSDVMPFLTDQLDVIVCGIEFGGREVVTEVHQKKPDRRLDLKPIAHQGTLCRRSVLEMTGGFDASFRICMDYDLFLRARKHGSRFGSAPIVIAHMDDGGISSRRDWASLQQRFAEERRAQLRHCEGLRKRLIYAIYWPLYLGYRRARLLVLVG